MIRTSRNHLEIGLMPLDGQPFRKINSSAPSSSSVRVEIQNFQNFGKRVYYILVQEKILEGMFTRYFKEKADCYVFDMKL